MLVSLVRLVSFSRTARISSSLGGGLGLAGIAHSCSALLATLAHAHTLSRSLAHMHNLLAFARAARSAVFLRLCLRVLGRALCDHAMRVRNAH